MDSLERRIGEVFNDSKNFELGNDNGVCYIIEKISNLEDLERSINLVASSLDEIEGNLVKEVGEKASDFYEAMSSLGCLSDQVLTLSNIAETIHGTILNISSQYENALDKLDALDHHQKVLQCSYKIVNELIEFLKDQSDINAMLESHSFKKAFECVTNKLDLLKGDVSQLNSIKPLVNELEEMRVALLKMQNANII